KMVDKREVEYILSPLGIGLFLTATEDTVILATSEDTLSRTLQSQTGEGLQLARNTNQEINLAQFYLNAGGIVKLIESLQGSLTMFTGGVAILAPGDMEAVRSLAITSGSVEYIDDMILSRSRHRYYQELL